MSKITVLIFALAVLSTSLAHKVEDDLNLNTDEKTQIAQIESKCISESGAKLDEVHKFDNGDFADSKELRNFYKCLLISFGVMDTEGRIVHSKINLLVPDNLRSKADHCFNREKGEPRDVAYETFKCYIQAVYMKT